MHKYKVLSKKGEGTFSEVLKAQSIKSQQLVAIKRMKSHFENIDQVKNLREIQALRRLSPHDNIIRLIEVLYDRPTGRLALVFELMSQNIYELIRGRRHYLSEAVVKRYMYQLCRAMDHMHRNGIFHRDIKPENILIDGDVLKLADFGSCRGIYSKQPYTEYISTRWYRAPESLLTDGYYNYKMDMWGVGCVFFEVLSLFPLFPGTNELDQIQKIHNVLGTPSADTLAKFKKRSPHMDFNFPRREGSGISKLIPHVSADCVDLITRLLAYNPEDRISARQALRHPYFRDLRDAEKRAAQQAQGAAGATVTNTTSGNAATASKNNSSVTATANANNANNNPTGSARSSDPNAKRSNSNATNASNHTQGHGQGGGGGKDQRQAHRRRNNNNNNNNNNGNNGNSYGATNASSTSLASSVRTQRGDQLPSIGAGAKDASLTASGGIHASTSSSSTTMSNNNNNNNNNTGHNHGNTAAGNQGQTSSRNLGLSSLHGSSSSLVGGGGGAGAGGSHASNPHASNPHASNPHANAPPPGGKLPHLGNTGSSAASAASGLSVHGHSKGRQPIDHAAAPGGGAGRGRRAKGTTGKYHGAKNAPARLQPI